jgi:CheY-like chemotaxis protein
MPTPVILLIEDEVADIELARVALADCRVPHKLESMTDGQQAYARLNGLAPFENRRRPALVLLDLGVPHMNGLELLRRVKEERATRAIPVVVFSGSHDPQTLQQAYACHANAFIRKGVDLRGMTVSLCMSVEYWLGQVTPADP